MYLNFEVSRVFSCSKLNLTEHLTVPSRAKIVTILFALKRFKKLKVPFHNFNTFVPVHDLCCLSPGSVDRYTTYDMYMCTSCTYV